MSYGHHTFETSTLGGMLEDMQRIFRLEDALEYLSAYCKFIMRVKEVDLLSAWEFVNKNLSFLEEEYTSIPDIVSEARKSLDAKIRARIAL